MDIRLEKVMCVGLHYIFESMSPTPFSVNLLFPLYQTPPYFTLTIGVHNGTVSTLPNTQKPNTKYVF